MRGRGFLWRVPPWRALLEGAGICVILLAPLLPVVLDATPLARSLYLVQLPLLCAVVAGLRMRFPAARSLRAAAGELGGALGLGLAVVGLVLGIFAALGRLDALTESYAGWSGTLFFLCMAVPEFLGVRAASWLWRRWRLLRRRRYVWGLTHAILLVVGALGLLLLVGLTGYIAARLGGDIWQIPAGSAFAQAVFWITVVVFLALLLMAGGLAFFLPPAALFSFLVARRMTGRVESLVTATRALRAGDLAAQLEVQGEDEIAELQADFNAMASDLQASMAALQSEKDKVETLLAARRDLVAQISHELRNPVAIILGYSDALRRDGQVHAAEAAAPESHAQPSPAQRALAQQALAQRALDRDLATIQYEAARVKAILDDLLTLAQEDADRLALACEQVDVTALVRRLVATFAPLAWNGKRVQVTLSMPQDRAAQDAAWVLADPQRLEQVLVNLVQNAVRHTSPGGVVAVAVDSAPGRVCIEVADTGEGIAPEALPHIWERYTQVGASLRPGERGAGLGLSLVKELTEAMGGIVAVESQVGEGTAFRVCFPAVARPAEALSGDPVAGLQDDTR